MTLTPQRALEFLCIGEGGEVTHYKVLDAMVFNSIIPSIIVVAVALAAHMPTQSTLIVAHSLP
ncbi:MAG TPA: hypothetical protein VE619_01605 [Nitrososphaeraceae archaeon]|nr:hypothetical protein [Nitrososphaeraceae archaeon]